jgi:hypothetical protein
MDMEKLREAAELLGYWPASTDEAHIAKLRAQNAHYDELIAQDPEGTKWQKMSGAWTKPPI